MDAQKTTVDIFIKMCVKTRWLTKKTKNCF